MVYCASGALVIAPARPPPPPLALGAAASEVDWIGLGSQRLLRVGLLVGCLSGAATLYFVVLRLTGIRLRDFARRS